jgi:hypothetical protein
MDFTVIGVQHTVSVSLRAEVGSDTVNLIFLIGTKTFITRLVTLNQFQAIKIE